MTPDMVDLDVFKHDETAKAVLLSRTGDRRDATWIARANIVLAMRGEVQALVSLPRWLAIQSGLIKPRAGEEQPGLFEGGKA